MPAGALAPATSPPPPLPEGYTAKLSVPFAPFALQFVAPAAVFLIFVLSFFSWVGISPGGVTEVSQSAWGAAFGGYTADEKVGPDWATKKDKSDEQKKLEPGADVPLIFYVLLLIPTLLVTGACLAAGFVGDKLPPAIQPVLAWRWAIVGGLNLILLGFLGMTLVFGFSLEGKLKDEVKDDKARRFLGSASAYAYGLSASPSRASPDKAENEKDRKEREAARAVLLDAAHRTVALNLVVVLHLLAILCAALCLWVNKRDYRKPTPRLEVLW